MRSQAHRVERPSVLEVLAALAGLTVAAVIVIGVAWIGLTALLSMATYIEALP